MGGRTFLSAIGGLENPPSLEKPMHRPVVNSDRHLKPKNEVSAHSDSFLNPHAPIRQHKHRLPHCQQGSVYYFVTWRLADSLPKEKLALWTKKNYWLQNNSPPWSTETESEYHERFSQTIDDWLDAGEGSCLLTDPRAAHSVSSALMHFDNERYVIDSFVVMPNHVHVMFRLIEPNRLEALVKSWKGFTAREINQELNKRGHLWQEDYWDRIIRDENHLLKCREYIRDNPVKARLTQDQFVLFNREEEEGGRVFQPALNGGQECSPPSNGNPKIMKNNEKTELQWLDVLDERFDWLNVADWEPRDGGLQPVRVPKVWRDRWPARTARRGMSAAGVAVRLRTSSKKLVLRVTFVDSPDAPDNPGVAWERSRPSFFSLYRNGQYISSICGA